MMTSALLCETLDELKVERTIGCGSFGRVKVATHIASGTIVALKILQKTNVVEMKQVRNIVRERDIVASLQHPNVLRLYSTFQDADCLYMMLELVNGGELYRLMHGDGSEENPLPRQQARFYAAQVISVYEHIHQRGLIYRDLKPENLLVTAHGYLKVVDWGFAKDLGGSADKTTFTMCGTLEYLAPEALNGSGHGQMADLWSLGALLYEMLVGYSPFVGDDVNDKIATTQRILEGSLEWPEELMQKPSQEGSGGHIDPAMRSLVEGLLTVNIHERLGSAYVSAAARTGGAASEHYYLQDIMEHRAYRDNYLCSGESGLSDGDGSASKVGEGARKMGGSDGLGCRFDDDLFSWTAMQSFAMAAPWVPSLPDGVSRDVSNFEDIFDDEPEEVLAYDGDQAVFQGF
jgi:serine/threonine protein kinase